MLRNLGRGRDSSGGEAVGFEAISWVNTHFLWVKMLSLGVILNNVFLVLASFP